MPAGHIGPHNDGGCSWAFDDRQRSTKATDSAPKPQFEIEVVITEGRCEMCAPPFIGLEVFYDKAVRHEIHGSMRLFVCKFHHRKVTEFAHTLLDREVLGL